MIAQSIVAICIITVLFLVWFYRDPSAFYNWNDNEVVAPSYGTVYEIHDHPDRYHIITFLDPLDVHRQYVPVNGLLREQEYDRSGNFHLAFRLCKSNMNEKMIHVFETAFGDITVCQVAGFLTRRIVSYAKAPDTVQAGQPLGLIKLGSRVDITIPKPFDLKVQVGDQLSGGRQVLGYLYQV